MRSPLSSECRRGSFPPLACSPRRPACPSARRRFFGRPAVGEWRRALRSPPRARTGLLVVPKRKSRARNLRCRARAAADRRGRRSGERAESSPSSASARAIRAGALRRRALRWRRRRDVVGYGLYLDLLGRAIAGKQQHASAIGDEETRVPLALDLAAEGRSVALVSSGDAGIYGLAPLVFELLDSAAETGMARPRDSRSCPGISALHGRCRAGRCAARPRFLCDLAIGSDDPVGDRSAYRLEAAAVGRFCRRAYNPRSARRQARLAEAAQILLRHRSARDPGLYRPQPRAQGEEASYNPTCPNWPSADIDMLTIVLVGSSRTR